MCGKSVSIAVRPRWMFFATAEVAEEARMLVHHRDAGAGGKKRASPDGLANASYRTPCCLSRSLRYGEEDARTGRCCTGTNGLRQRATVVRPKLRLEDGCGDRRVPKSYPLTAPNDRPRAR